MTGRIEKTVFISYRRTNLSWALAIYQNLTSQDYDVFFDYESINSGDFEQIILGNIKARAHFLVILTPSALKRCVNPDDWLRREIETALSEKRNIVPLFLEGFDFGSPSISTYLTGRLSFLKNYNGLNIPSDYFKEAMERLGERFLNISLDAVLHPVSLEVEKIVQKQQATVNRVAQVEIKELNSQEFFEKGLQAKEISEKIQYFTDSIRKTPDYADAYYYRGVSRENKNDLNGGIEDYTEALRLRQDYPEAFYSRGLTHIKLGNIDYAIKDFTEAIRLRKGYLEAYLNRGLAFIKKKRMKHAVVDFSQIITLEPNYADAYYNRAIANINIGSLDEAIIDLTETIRLKPDFAEAYEKRASVWKAKKDNLSSEADLQKFYNLGGVKEMSFGGKLFGGILKSVAILVPGSIVYLIVTLVPVIIVLLCGFGVILLMLYNYFVQ